MDTITMISIPVVTGLIGWVTNVIAVKMLFRPRQPISLGFMTLQGVVPKRQKALASSLAQLIDKELLSVMELVAQFHDIDIEGEVGTLLDKHLDRFIEKVKSSIPMASMFITGSLEASLKQQARVELLQMIPELRTTIGNKMHDHYDLKAFIESKILAFSLDKMEEMALSIATKELKTIERLGGVLGVIIGVIQVIIMTMIA